MSVRTHLPLLFYFACRPRLPPSLEPAFTSPPPPPSFLSSSPPSRTPPHTRAVESSADRTRFRLPVPCVRAESSRRAAPSHLPISPHIPSPHPHPAPPHPSSSPPSYTYTPHPRALPAPIANSHSAGTQLHIPARVQEMRADASSYLRCAARHRRTASRPRTPPPLLPPTISFLISTLTHHLPRPPALAPPHTFCPRLGLGAACGMRAVCVDGVPVHAGQRAREFSMRGPSLRAHFGVCTRCTLPQIHTPRRLARVARAECARSGFAHTLRRLRTLHAAAQFTPRGVSPESVGLQTPVSVRNFE
ncbi:hypothetical protein C8F04DRAFT_1349903 [Mycena alexandri]|uniref:Uncharacterized protein n=1 Tax=Mycena alexandri TaxID=1745969 RepID=A0AAD6RVN4_9AGAR|nr:hypothetical protein C8F04DRAFT_1349903 [Mycena alexandri]